MRIRETVLAEGSFRLALTPQHRVFALLDARTVLGPLRVRVEIQSPAQLAALARAERQRTAMVRYDERGRALALPRDAVVAGFFDDIGSAIGKVAEGTFNAASKAITAAARPVFDVAKTAAATATRAVAKAIPGLPTATRQQLEAAARVMTRVRLGDMRAKDFVRGVVSAAKSGLQGARAIGNVLIDANRVVARAVGAPLAALGHVPILGGAIKALNPTEAYDHMLGAIQRGDWKRLQEIAKAQLSNVQGVISLVPGVGTGIGTALAAGMAILDGGKPLEIAIRAAYGAIPIPPGVRTVTDSVLAAVLSLALRGDSLTDAAIVAARERVPAGFPRDVFDTLIRLVAKRTPIKQAGQALISHYVNQYSRGAIGNASADLARLLPMGRILQPLRVGEVDEAGLELGAEVFPTALDIVGLDDLVDNDEVGAELPNLGDDIAILTHRIRRAA